MAFLRVVRMDTQISFVERETALSMDLLGREISWYWRRMEAIPRVVLFLVMILEASLIEGGRCRADHCVLGSFNTIGSPLCVVRLDARGQHYDT